MSLPRLVYKETLASSETPTLLLSGLLEGKTAVIWWAAHMTEQAKYPSKNWTLPTRGVSLEADTPIESSDEKAVPANTLITTLWEILRWRPSQTMPWFPTHGLWDNILKNASSI